MEVKELRKKKEQLENSITEQILKFTEETGLDIEEVEIHSVCDLGIGYRHNFRLHIRI